MKEISSAGKVLKFLELELYFLQIFIYNIEFKREKWNFLRKEKKHRTNPFEISYT